MPINSDSLSGWGTIYAAFVATGALFLEARRWFESGVKLNLATMIGAILIPREPGDKKYIVALVTNRGDSPTTVTHLGFVWYDSWWAQFRKKPSRSLLVNRASDVQPLPFFLAPGAQWSGRGIQTKEIEELLDTGRLWMQVYATHDNKPTSLRLKKPKEPEGEPLAGAG